MTSIAPSRTIYAGDDLYCLFEWRSGTKKAPGLPIDLTSFAFEAGLYRSGKKVADGVVTTVPLTGRVTVLVNEIKTATLSGEYELRVRYTDSRSITKTILIVPVEVRQ